AATPEARAEAVRRVAELATLAERLAAERPVVDELVAAAEAARARADEVANRLRLLDALAAPAGIDELAARVAEAEALRARCAELDEEAVAAVADAEERLAALPDRRGLEATRGDHRRRADLTGSLARGEAAEAEAAAAVADAAAAADAATADQAARVAERERIRVALRAQALVPELAVGAPCPVCGQDVAELPAHEPPADLARAEAAVAAAEAALAAAGRALTDARTRQARVDEKLVRVRAEVAAVDERLAGAPGLDRVEHDLALVDEAGTALDKARQAERDARKAIAAATEHLAALAGQVEEARRGFDAARDAVAALGPPPAGRRDLAADWAALLAWAAERAPALGDELGAHRDAADRAIAAAGDRRAAVALACREAGVDPGRAATWPGEAVAAARATAAAEVARLDEGLAAAEALRADRAGATERQQVAESLAGLLAANRFEKWLLDEALHQLVAGASGLLDELSGGAYALTVDGRSGGFGVVDHTNASQVRSARTLSGGETFLASLALALALADQVAGLAVAGAARLEALFLDEGFGTLDPATLDVVAAALDELGAQGRMVGVVTHVRELADRLPVRFEVTKVGGSSTVERVEA
ncbi:MAG TPA: SbcC/MukB-like Walker B domain-containing protein, partial [Acidimicrobiales bacterium]|nr:SbcC/MukB-like Walker B domain-containing protein [Acidimicrobiales bacterium]